MIAETLRVREVSDHPQRNPDELTRDVLAYSSTGHEILDAIERQGSDSGYVTVAGRMYQYHSALGMDRETRQGA